MKNDTVKYNKKAIIIGAGPAGLTAAYELLTRTNIKPIILERSGDIGGISKTVNYKGNRIDIGGHRFFSKSDRVMDWWFRFMPLETTTEGEVNINYQNRSRALYTTGASGTAPLDKDKVMLLRRRLSRIYFLRQFFNYPLNLSPNTLRKLGILLTMKIGFSYTFARLFPRRKERTLEDFMINRFGKTLYKTFFKDYTEKVWGVNCNEISAEWGAQRIKGVSITKAVAHALKRKKKDDRDIAQKNVETSQIERFLYPKHGPGQLWEEVARQIESMGGEIIFHQKVTSIANHKDGVSAIQSIHSQTGETKSWEGDYFFSTMPVNELIGGMSGNVPNDVKEVAAGLLYRDFITVGLLLKQFSTQDKATGGFKKLSLEDTWIYVQEKDVKVGRLQLFNNWSPFLVKDPATSWIGMEYFCNKEDDFWNLSEEVIKETAIIELEKIGLARKEDVLDATVLRMEKTYPAYFGTYDRFDVIRNFVDSLPNLYLIGRNGMHKYNNSDHSMLTAMTAVDNIVAGIADKSNIWSINTEMEYHEETKK
ncbi:NAD(P)/FAD-dependent oxidoreductase [Niastella sp. OAS944]|uniref:NAD(P)/FAD-dependent oxidoreductase n=1 Tax=Niastella sp. OAS944 TaxID=2664089 RepID=UPI0034903736